MKEYEKIFNMVFYWFSRWVFNWRYFRTNNTYYKMYLEIHQDKECSACGAVNKYEFIERGNNYFVPYCVQSFIRCTECGHEKLLHTTTAASTGDPVSYQIKSTDNKVKF